MSTQQKTSTQGKTRNLNEINFSESEAITLIMIRQDLGKCKLCVSFRDSVQEKGISLHNNYVQSAKQNGQKSLCYLVSTGS